MIDWIFNLFENYWILMIYISIFVFWACIVLKWVIYFGLEKQKKHRIFKLALAFLPSVYTDELKNHHETLSRKGHFQFRADAASSSWHASKEYARDILKDE